MDIITSIDELIKKHNGKYYSQARGRNGEHIVCVHVDQEAFVHDIKGQFAAHVEVSVDVAQNLDDHGWIDEEGESAIEAAEDLEDLEAIFRADAFLELSIMSDQESSDLPIFGGEEPEDTDRVWSWDEDRLLVGDGGSDMQIVNRDEWESR